MNKAVLPIQYPAYSGKYLRESTKMSTGKLINRYNSSLRHPRHCNRLHNRRDLIAVLGL